MEPEAHLMSPTSVDALSAARVDRKLLDRETFQRAYENVVPALRSYARRTTGSDDLADEIVQETFLRILRRPLPPLADTELKSYLFKTATALLNDHWRKISRERRWRQLTSFARRQSYHRPAENGIDELFRKLKPRQRALLWLAYVEGYNHEEIAGILDLAEKSVRVLLFRARRNLAALLAGKAPCPEGGK